MINIDKDILTDLILIGYTNDMLAEIEYEYHNNHDKNVKEIICTK